MSSPTRILREPYWETRTVGIGGWAGDRIVRFILVETDAGTFTVSQLAATIGVHHSTLWRRLFTLSNWTDPNVLNPPAKKGRRIDGSPLGPRRRKE